jgi:hypothetical protein
LDRYNLAASVASNDPQGGYLMPRRQN